MSAKLLQSLKDDNSSDLRKQIGCMTGLFQFLGSRQFLNGKRLKRISSGNSQSLIIEPNNNLCNQQNSMENKLIEGVDEDQSLSSEQSTISLASSSCSSSSPFDCSMTSLPEPSFEHLSFLEGSSKNASLNQWNTSFQLCSHSLESMRDRKNHIMNQVPSSGIKFNEPPGYSKKNTDFPRPFLKGGSLSVSASSDACRFSCDGRDISKDPFKSSLRIKEQHPRLSLDSKEPKSRLLSRNPQRTPGVVAKLMGLDTLPASCLNSNPHIGFIKTDQDKDCDENSSSVSSSTDKNPIRFSNYLKNSWKNPDFVPKPISNPDSAKPQFQHVKASLSSESLFPTFYDEIEKRLKDSECQQSGKDVQTLMHILEAMNQKLLQDTSEEDEEDYSKNDLSLNDDRRIRRQQMLKNDHMISSTIPRDDFSPESPIVIMKPSRTIKNPGVSVSSMNMVDLRDSHSIQDHKLSHMRNDFTKSHSRKSESSRAKHKVSAVNSGGNKVNSKNSRLMQEPQNNEMRKENSKRLIRKSEESLSLKTHQKKHEFDGRSRPPNKFSNWNKIRRQPNKKPAESLLSDKKISSESQKLHKKSNDQLSGIIYESRNDWSIPSDSLKNVVDLETEQTGSGNWSLCGWNGVYINNKPCSQMVSENGSLTGLEHPSPVSVLDPLEDIGDASSHVKPDSFNGESAAGRFYEEEISSNIESGYGSEISRKKLQNVDNLVQKLKRLNSTHDEGSRISTDYVASICEKNTNPDHRYISEILLASGLLLRDASSHPEAYEFHSSGHPINPDLFYVLEQRRCERLDTARLHRKLIFDTLNEILVWKFGRDDRAVGAKRARAQKLVEEVCFKIEEVKRRMGGEEVLDDGLKRNLWVKFGCEIGEIVLGVERLVFKDLVDEILLGEGYLIHRRRHCRQLVFEG